MKSATVFRPSKEALGKIAERQPALLNLLVAYFVFEWQSVRIGNPPHGVDQTGTTCLIPDYIDMWTESHVRSGIDTAIHLLLQCPEKRDADDSGYLSTWMRECSEIDTDG